MVRVEVAPLDAYHLARRRLHALDRDPGGLLLLHPRELFLDRGVGHRRHPPFDPEAARPLERVLGPDLHQEVELDRAAVFELEVPDGGSVMGLRDSVARAVSQLSRITSSSTLWRMASPNRLRTTAAGPCRGGNRAAGPAARST